MASKAIPSHLKAALGGGTANGGDSADFQRRHHGKTQSHVVSSIVGSDAFANPYLLADARPPFDLPSGQFPSPALMLARAPTRGCFEA